MMNGSSDLAFKDSVSLVRDIIMMVSPAQTSEAMHFFRVMLRLYGEYREDGATWAMLSIYYREMVAIVESPALDFSNGLGGGCVLFKLDLQVFDRRTEARYELDKRLRAHKDDVLRASVRKGADTKPPLARSSPTKPLAVIPPPPPPGQLSPDEWKAKVEKLVAGCPEVDGKKPCRSWFIKGACPRGDKCFAHHKGAAGSFK